MDHLMDSQDPPGATPDQTADASDDPTTDENNTETPLDRSPVSRRGTLAALLGVGGLGLFASDSATAQPVRPWKNDIDADGNALFDLGSLAMFDNPTAITDFEGTNLAIDANGVLNATDTDTDTRTNVSDDGAQVVTDTEDINFRRGLAVTDDTDDTVTVDTPWGDVDADSLLEAPEDDGIDVDFVKTPRIGTTDPTAFEGVVDDELFLRIVPTATDVASTIIAGHSSNSVPSGVVGATIAGGGQSALPNTATGIYATVGGGTGNKAKASQATVSGGIANEVSAESGTIGGGNTNKAAGMTATVGGGGGNRASSLVATVGGGLNNTASGERATVGGGDQNMATSESATVGGGQRNQALANFATVAGGGPSDPSNPTTTNNRVFDDYGTISGGGRNRVGTNDNDTTTAPYATVGGGENNIASGERATVSGGAGNVADKVGTTVGGGENNTASDFTNNNLGNATVAGGVDNTASYFAATVGGGNINTASGYTSTVAGGQSNDAEASFSTVGGGNGNTVSGFGATVPGGFNNTADASYSFAAGRMAKTNGKSGAFVLGDSSSTAILAQNADEVRSQMPMYAPSFNTTSARAKKTNVGPVEPEAVLEGVESLEISTWELDHQDDGRHVGPMAGDFHDQFEVGGDTESIASVDADGVALAAIQGLAAKLDERDAELASNGDRIADLERENERKDDRIDELAAENEQLRDRLQTIEDRIDDVAAGESSPATVDD